MPFDPFTLTLSAALTAAAILSATKAKSLTDPNQAGQPGMDPQAMEMLKAGPENRQIAKIAGTWEVDCTMWMKPGDPPVQSTGTAIFSTLFEDRFLQCEYRGSFMGQPFHGRSTMGYDRGAKRYFMTWYDSMNTSLMMLTGTSSDGGKTITYTGEGVCPQMGRMALRQVETHQSDDRFTLEMYQTPIGGKESKSMELTYRRRH